MKIYRYLVMLFFLLSAATAFANQTLRLDNGKAFVISDDFQKVDQLSTNIITTYQNKEQEAFIQTLNFGKEIDLTLEEVEKHRDEITNSFISGIEGGGGNCENLTKVVSQTKSGSPILILNYDVTNPSGLKICGTTYFLLINRRMSAVTCACQKELLSTYVLEFSKIEAQIYDF